MMENHTFEQNVSTTLLNSTEQSFERISSNHPIEFEAVFGSEFVAVFDSKIKTVSGLVDAQTFSSENEN
ncbi:9229_t:CDS:2, partial [Cetraspora pellucida]